MPSNSSDPRMISYLISLYESDGQMNFPFYGDDKSKPPKPRWQLALGREASKDFKKRIGTLIDAINNYIDKIKKEENFYRKKYFEKKIPELKNDIAKVYSEIIEQIKLIDKSETLQGWTLHNKYDIPVEYLKILGIEANPKKENPEGSDILKRYIKLMREM